jgi:oligopeptide transport system substrate-binding protein
MTDYLGFDVRRPPFDDARVRRAFAMATDRETLAGVVRRAYALPATGGYLPPGMPGHSAGIGLPYDPEGARSLLAEAGYPGGRGFPALEALGAFSPNRVPMLQYLQGQWQENLQVTITWPKIEFRAFFDRMSNQVPPLWYGGWMADYPDPDNFMRVSSCWTDTGWQNAAYDRLVEDARRTVDQETRLDLYRQADQILVEEAPIVPLTHGSIHLLVKPYVTQFPISPISGWFYKDVVIEPH